MGAIITVEKPLKTALGDDGADALVRLLNQIRQEQKEDILEFVEEKFETRLSEKISKVNERITNEVASLKVNNQKTRSDLIKWMFIFWLGQVWAILSILFVFFK